MHSKKLSVVLLAYVDFVLEKHKKLRQSNYLVSSWILTPRQPNSHLRTNHAVKIILHQFKTQVTKTHVCVIHWYNVNSHPSIHQCTIARFNAALRPQRPYGY